MVEYTWSKNLSIRKIKSFLKKYPLERSILSTTRDISGLWPGIINEYIPCELLTSETVVPIENLYETPATLGKDRLAGVIAASSLYPEKTCLVIDIGTCITFDVIDYKKRYLGGNISPGWRMRMMAMNKFTDKLPMVDLTINEEMIGTSTVKALQNGAFYGTKGEIESFIRSICKKYESVAVIFTGGDAEEFAKTIESKIFVHPYLVLEGLNEILIQNAA